MDKIDEDTRRDAIQKLDFDVDVYEGVASETPNGSYTFGSFSWGDYLFSIPRSYAETMFPKLFELT
jgi:hypothetical protein